LYAAKAAGRNCTFLHNGIGCVLADGTPAEGQSAQASRLVELIHSPEAQKPPEELQEKVEPLDFGTFLPREAISAELQQICDELRKYLEERARASKTDELVRSTAQ